MLRRWSLLLSLALTGCGAEIELPDEPELVSGPALLASTETYLGQEPPGSTPELFLPQILEDGKIEHGVAISPSLDEVYVTVSNLDYSEFDVLRIHWNGVSWSGPAPAFFSGANDEHGTSFSPSGETILFSSTRPDFSSGGSALWRIWKAEREEEAWGTPELLDFSEPLNVWHSHGSMAFDGSIYFHARTKEKTGDGALTFDLVRADPSSEGKYSIVDLGSEINTEQIEVTPHISPDETYLIFTSYGRPDGIGNGDLYISIRAESGEWSAAKNLGSPINTPGEESNPHVTPDGRYLIFSRSSPQEAESSEKISGPGLHLYWVAFEPEV